MRTKEEAESIKECKKLGAVNVIANDNSNCGKMDHRR